MFVMAFQTRDIDEGKGERQLFYWFIVELSKYFFQTVLDILPQIPNKYGSWKDVILLIELVEADIAEVKNAFRENTRQVELGRIKTALLQMFEKQLLTDVCVCVCGEAQLGGRQSLAGKWAPRLKSHFSTIAKELAIMMYHDKDDFNSDGSRRTDSIDTAKEKLAHAKRQFDANPLPANRQVHVAAITNEKMAIRSAYKRYRHLCSRLNQVLNTSEVIMCDKSGKWDQLRPGAIPAKCLKIHRKAFLNQTLKGGNQRSSRGDRVQCAEIFRTHMEKAIANPGKAKVHGAKLQPHEMVKGYFNGASYDITLEAQWVDLRQRLLESGTLEFFVSIVDTSGSMTSFNATPMYAALGLGILISEICHEAFRGRFLTFSENPTWHNLGQCSNLYEKVRSARSTNWGYSTDIGKALSMILDGCTQGNMTNEQVQKMVLVILSDMQFDKEHSCGYSSKQDQIAQKFKNAGYFDHQTGEPIVPRIIFWNLRGDTLDFPATAGALNVDMVSGFSQAGLKAFMAGDVRNAAEHKTTPYDGMRKQLDEERYDDVRLVCENSDEFKSRATGQRYVAPIRADTEEEDSPDCVEDVAGDMPGLVENPSESGHMPSMSPWSTTCAPDGECEDWCKVSEGGSDRVAALENKVDGMSTALGNIEGMLRNLMPK
jgi:Mg-chelatase subunit ChlD